MGQIENSSGKNPYSDYSNIATCIFPQESQDIEVFVSGASVTKGIHIWVDWNNDQVFDETTELVYEASENLTQYSTNITVPSNTFPGIKRLRIRLYDNNSINNSPCGNSSDGEVEDYAVNVLPGEECTVASIPQNIQIGNVQSDSVEILWDAIQEASAYELRYRITGSNTWNLVEDIFYNSYSLKDLSPSTQYELQVRSKCNAQNTSEFSASITAYTNLALDHLEFSEIVQNGETGWPMAPININILDINGNLSNFDSKVSLDLIDINQTGAQINGYMVRNAENGSVSFEDLIIDTPGLYKLEASVEGLPALQSNSFEIITSGENTFIVNTIEDTSDANLYDNQCEDINGDCSLRAALQNANKTLARDIIEFNIPGEGPHQINPGDILPPIIAPIELNGTTQAGYTFDQPQIVISGINIPITNTNAIGLSLLKGSSNSSITGLIIGDFGKVKDTLVQSGIGILVNSDNNNIQANYIGVGADGETPLTNSYGIVLVGFNNLVGGSDPENRNIISGNSRYGVEIGYTSFENIIQGNYIGTNSQGTEKVPNGYGIWARETNTYDGNLISGNSTGIYIEYDNNLLVNNFIGTDYSGKVAIPNDTGIIVNGQNNLIGTPGAGNLISGNFTIGIEISGGSNNIVEANNIGTDIEGIGSIPNRIGVIIGGGTNNHIGGSAMGSRNIISGNSDNGIHIANSTFNEVFGNIIGVKGDEISPLPNGKSGIYISGNNNQIGDLDPGLMNIIGMNTQGVAVAGIGNKISGNKMFGNNIGIDLGPDNRNDRNDRNDSDSGANNYQNYPEINSAAYDGTNLDLNFILDSHPSYSVYPIKCDVYKSDGNRQGKEYIGSYLIDEFVSLKGNNYLSIQITNLVGSPIVSGDIIVATATDAEGNTSEFSDDVIVTVTGSCTPQTWYADTDSDGLGDPNNTVEECSAPSGYVSNANDCDDTDVSMGAVQTWYLDADGDEYGDPGISQTTCSPDPGYILDNTDCDDTMASVHPGAVDDTVDGIDQNCDGTDGPLTNCQGVDTIVVTEECSTNTTVYWNISNPGNCEVSGRWELRKNSSTGDSAGTFTLAGGESIQIVSGTVSKGKTQIVVYWNDSNGLEVSTNQNASGVNCASGMALASESEIFMFPLILLIVVLGCISWHL